MRSSHELPICRVRLNSPLWCLLELLFCFYKMWSSNEISTLFPKNAEFKQTPHCVLQECRVCFNSPVSFYAMWSLLGLPSASKKCAVCFNSPLHFYKMCSLPEPPSVFFKNVESAWVPPSVFKNAELKQSSCCVFQRCRVHLNSPCCFYKSLLEIPTVFLENVEPTPCCVFQKCRACFNSPLCFYKLLSLLELPTVLFKNADFNQRGGLSSAPPIPAGIRSFQWNEI